MLTGLEVPEKYAARPRSAVPNVSESALYVKFIIRIRIMRFSRMSDPYCGPARFVDIHIDRPDDRA